MVVSYHTESQRSQDVEIRSLSTGLRKRARFTVPPYSAAEDTMLCSLKQKLLSFLYTEAQSKGASLSRSLLLCSVLFCSASRSPRLLLSSVVLESTHEPSFVFLHLLRTRRSLYCIIIYADTVICNVMYSSYDMRMSNLLFPRMH